jgi:hypothetical protein
MLLWFPSDTRAFDPVISHKWEDCGPVRELSLIKLAGHGIIVLMSRGKHVLRSKTCVWTKPKEQHVMQLEHLGGVVQVMCLDEASSSIFIVIAQPTWQWLCMIVTQGELVALLPECT